MAVLGAGVASSELRTDDELDVVAVVGRRVNKSRGRRGPVGRSSSSSGVKPLGWLSVVMRVVFGEVNMKLVVLSKETKSTVQPLRYLPLPAPLPPFLL